LFSLKPGDEEKKILVRSEILERSFEHDFIFKQEESSDIVRNDQIE
jgi:hypothetical protein